MKNKMLYLILSLMCAIVPGHNNLLAENIDGFTDPQGSPNARKLYSYLKELNDKPERSTENRLIIGQVFDKTWDGNGFEYNIEKLHEISGKYPALFQSWLDYPWSVGRAHVSGDFIYPLFRNYYHRGAILMLLVNPYNPWNGQHIKELIPAGHTLSEVYTEGTSAYRVYREYLSNLADILSYFSKEDIPIILRTFGENNGKWFWFHHGQANVKKEEFQSLWKYTVTYLRQERGLHNLLFCYEVTENRLDNVLNGLVPELTDILGIQGGWNREIWGKTSKLYEAYLPYNKPIMMPQFLPAGSEENSLKLYDNLEVLTGLLKYNPKLIGYSPWFSQEGRGKVFAIVKNPHAKEMMNHPLAITMDETPFVDPKPPKELTIPKTQIEQTVKMPASSFVWNFDSDNDSWTIGNSVLANSIKEGRLNLFIFGENAFIEKEVIVATSKFKTLLIRLRNHSTSTNMSLQWQVKGEDSLDVKKQMQFSVGRNTPGYIECKIKLSENKLWNGTVKKLRLNIAPESVTGSTEIDYIVLE